MKTLAVSSIKQSFVLTTGEQHSLGKSFALHLIPGVFILALFMVSVSFVMRVGFPPLFAMIAFGSTFGIGFQLWHLFHEGRKRNGRASLEGIVLYRESMPVWQYFILVPLFIVVAFLIDGATAPLKSAFLQAMPWLPEWFEVRDPRMFTAYTRQAVIITFAASLLMNGLIGPIVEELYFRGYLMPRLSRFGRWTPVVETVLFTLYHFWQPYYWIAQFFFMLPIVFGVSWKRNIKLGIVVHVALNLLGGLLTALAVLGKM